MYGWSFFMEPLVFSPSVVSGLPAMIPVEVRGLSDDGRFLAQMELQERERFRASLCTESEQRAALVPRLVAHMLLDPDGALNLTRVPNILNHLLSPQACDDLVDRTVREFCVLLIRDPTIQNAIERIKVPRRRSLGERIVQLSCGVCPDYVPTLYDLRWTVLSALLTRWKEEVPTCVVDAKYVEMHDNHIELLIRDFGDILTSGGLLRHVYDTPYPLFFPATEWPMLGHTARYATWEETLRLFPAIEQSWIYLGGTRAEFDSHVQKPSLYSLLGLFDELRKEKGRSVSDLYYAVNLVEGVGRPLLPAFWTRAVGGMLVPRLSRQGTYQSQLMLQYWLNFFDIVRATLEAIVDADMKDRFCGHSPEGVRLRDYLYNKWFVRLNPRFVCDATGEPALAWFLDSQPLRTVAEYSRFCQESVCDLYRFARNTTEQTPEARVQEAIRRISIPPFEGRGYVLFEHLCSPLAIHAPASSIPVTRLLSLIPKCQQN
jgi:hypothetical protein